jgi:CxxC motif-containing protein (DUF1111 family)
MRQRGRDGYLGNDKKRARSLRRLPLFGLGCHLLGSRFALAGLGGLRDSHDGQSLNFTEAILRHGNEAASARSGFQSLGENDKRAVILFLKSL